MATEKNITMKQFNGTDYDTLYPKTIASQVDGLLSAQIFVTTLPNTEVTASLNGRTVSAMSDSSGLAVLKILSYGTWTVSATINGMLISIDFEIKAVAQYEMILFPDLETASWDVISSVSESGLAPNLLSVGDKKTVTINGVNYQAQIIGFNHDTKTSGGTAGITFQLVNCLNTKYKMETSSGAHNGGWGDSLMRNTTLNSTIYGQLSSDLKAVIKAVNKVTYVKNSTPNLKTTSDKLFLLSEIEVFGSTTYSASGEGKQYEYYAAGNSTIKTVSGSASDWWERSLYARSPDRYCRVEVSGKAQVEDASQSLGVSFAFCV